MLTLHFIYFMGDEGQISVFVGGVNPTSLGTADIDHIKCRYD